MFAEKRQLGSSGLAVAPIGFGGSMLSSVSDRPDEMAAIAVIHAALDGGVSLLDTADVYCRDPSEIGHNERLIARALAARPGADVIVATKGGQLRDGWASNGRPDHLRRACEASLRALGVECITLYLLHTPDAAVPFAESVGALAELRRSGKIQHVGLSNVTLEQIREAQAIAPIVCVQNHLSPFDRTAVTSGVLAHCERNGIAFLAHSPLGGAQAKHLVPGCEPLLTVAKRRGTSPHRVALAWLLSWSPSIIAITGAARVASVTDSVAAMATSLTAEDRAELYAALAATERP